MVNITELLKESPFKSKAQRRKFYALKDRGEMSQSKIDEWESETPKNIPERVKKKEMKKAASLGRGKFAELTKISYEKADIQ